MQIFKYGQAIEYLKSRDRKLGAAILGRKEQR